MDYILDTYVSPRVLMTQALARRDWRRGDGGSGKLFGGR
jgi:hypothetical protein